MQTILYEPAITVDRSKFELFHDGMSLTWDQVTDIYEDKSRIDYVAFDSNKCSVNETLQRMLELGFLNFGFDIILKSNHIVLWHLPGGVDTLKTHMEKVAVWAPPIPFLFD